MMFSEVKLGKHDVLQSKTRKTCCFPKFLMENTAFSDASAGKHCVFRVSERNTPSFKREFSENFKFRQVKNRKLQVSFVYSGFT